MSSLIGVAFEIDISRFNKHLIERIVKKLYNPRLNAISLQDAINEVYNNGKGGGTSIYTAVNKNIGIDFLTPGHVEGLPNLRKDKIYITTGKDPAELEDPGAYSQFIKDVHTLFSALPDATGLFVWEEEEDLQNFPNVNPKENDFVSKIYSGAVFLSKSMVEKIGKEKLSNMPAKEIRFFEHGGAYVQAGDTPFGADKEQREKINKYLNEN